MEQLIDIIGKIKDLKRSGWCKRNVSSPESVADHSFGVALLAFLLTPDNLDKEKCLKLAIVHDLQEIYAGDITPCDAKLADKPRLEREAAQRLSRELGNSEFLELFNEFEAQITPEARFVKGLDKIECVMQAAYYDKNQRSPVQLIPEFLGNFRNWLYHAKQHPLILEVLDNLTERKIK